MVPLLKKDKKNTERKTVNLTSKAIAIAKNLKMTPRKARLIIDLVRGKSVVDALSIVSNINKIGVTDVLKVIKSAVSNATHNLKMNAEKLYISSIFANDGKKYKRFMPRAKGRSCGILKRMCNITVVVEERK